MSGALPAMGGRYAFHVWSDGCAVFDRSSGDTHVLDVFSAMQFLSGLKAPASVIERLQFSGIPADSLSSALDDAGLRLEKLKLPYPMPS
ncbi:MAG: hypothetical protein Q8O34_03280 [Rhodocyclaceae bacterium]|nr:hypothetical protein [Rhodocyclaceae bacterium]